MKTITLNQDGTFEHYWPFGNAPADAISVTNSAALTLSENPQTKKYVAGSVVDVPVVPATVAERKLLVQQKLKVKLHEKISYEQLLAMVVILDKQSQAPLAGSDIAEQAQQRVIFGNITALEAHAKQLESDLDSDVNADIENGW